MRPAGFEPATHGEGAPSLRVSEARRKALAATSREGKRKGAITRVALSSAAGYARHLPEHAV